MEDRILVVDDEKEIRELLLKALTRLSIFEWNWLRMGKKL